MSVRYIFSQAGSKMGLDPSDSTQRSVLLRYLNEAAQELYEQADLEDSLLEQLFRVNGDQQIAFPPDVGPIRAMREYSTHVAWHLANKRPRYNQFNWKDRWRNWRYKGTSPLSYPLVNSAPLSVIVDSAESPNVVVSVTGPTLKASQITENLTLNASLVQSSNNFTDIVAITKDRINTFDVYVLDADQNVLAQIPNNTLSVKYRIVDVSLYPWSNTSQTTANHIMEVLYKKALPYLQDDGDEYPIQGCDNILVNKMLQLWYEDQGKGDVAAAYDAKATRTLARKKEDEGRGQEHEAALVEHPHDTLLTKNRHYGPGRYTGQVYY